MLLQFTSLLKLYLNSVYFLSCCLTVVSSPKQTEIIKTTNIIMMKQREGVAIWTRKGIIIKKLDIKQDLIVEQKPIEVKRKKNGVKIIIFIWTKIW